jgi:hypothetical protein
MGAALESIEASTGNRFGSFETHMKNLSRREKGELRLTDHRLGCDYRHCASRGRAALARNLR